MQNSKKRKLKPQNLLIVLACICLIIGTFVVLLSNHSASNSDSKTKTVNKHYETIATVMIDAGYVSYIRQDDKASEQITEYICKNLSGLDWTHDRGTLTTEFYPLHVVDEQKIPAILFEAGFSTNTKEIQKLKNSTNQKKVAQAIAKAFNKYITENK